MFGASWDGTDEDETIEIRDGARAERSPIRWPSTRTPPTTTTSRSATRSTSSRRPAGTRSRSSGPSASATATASAAPRSPCGTRRRPPRCSAPRASYDAIDIRVAEGEDVATVQQRIAEVLPDNIEVVDQETLIDESNSQVNEFIGPIGTGLLIFAFITAFVSAFLINNVFAITIGQRLRELALLRAVGGAGRQVRRLIVVEALVMSVIATIIGIFAGIGVAKLILGDLQRRRRRVPRLRDRAQADGRGHGLPRRRRHHRARRARAGPARVADPAGGGDAARARVRRAEHQASRRRHGHDDRRRR